MSNNNKVLASRKRERGVAFAAVNCLMELVPEEMKRDKDIVLAAVTQNGNALRFASTEFL